MGQQNEDANGATRDASVRAHRLTNGLWPSALRSLDHVAIAVHDVEKAAEYFTGVLGLVVVADEIAEDPGVRLLYLDAGTTLIQLLEPVREHAQLWEWLRVKGEGLHHICFATEDLRQCEAILNQEDKSRIFQAGRGASAFFLNDEPSNVKIEVTGPSPS